MAQALPINVTTSVTESATGSSGTYENSEVELNPNGNGAIVKDKVLVINPNGNSY